MDQHQQQGFKHSCRICKKGFGCGRALGGHMRAHGINDVDMTDDDDDPSASGEYCDDDDKPPGPRRMYALRTNPNRLKSCRSCENCGKEFLSWKSFLDHGKEDDVGIGCGESPTSSDGGDDLGCAGWSKGKRSRRTKAVAAVARNASTEEEELANWLVMLSAARVEPAVAAVETEESCASASKEDPDHCLPTAAVANFAAAERAKAPAVPGVPRGMFECKACKKVFSSHQALGGHRASHKKVKGCYAAKMADEAGLDGRGPTLPDDEVVVTHENPITDVEAAEMAVAMSMAMVPFDNAPLAVAPLKKKNAKVHECSICHRVFASGQALGGHKRCHWITSNAPDPMASSKLQGSHLTLRPIFDPPSDVALLDLNLPVTPDHGLAALRQTDIGSPLRLEVPAVYLQPWIDQANPNKKNKMAATSGCSNFRNNNNSVDNPNCSINNNETYVDDEADSKVKLAKLSDLKDLKDSREAASPWLQVGIGTSTTNECGCDP